MAEKILMNKNTLAALKVELQGYRTALPVFEMKEQQLKEVAQTILESVQRLEKAIDRINAQTKPWVALFAEANDDLDNIVNIKHIKTSEKEIAGVTINIFEDLTFEDYELDLYNTPLWIDAAIDVIKDQKTNYRIIALEKENLELVQEELAEARRMKNALKEVFIPETKHNIRKIEIYLGDVERLAIGCAKLVKKKKQTKTTAV